MGRKEGRGSVIAEQDPNLGSPRFTTRPYPRSKPKLAWSLWALRSSGNSGEADRLARELGAGQ